MRWQWVRFGNSSSVEADNTKQDILIFDKGPTEGLDDIILTIVFRLLFE